MSGKESAPQMAPVESSRVVSSVKLPILKKVIMNGVEPVQTTKDENGVETDVPPKTAQALLQRQRERKAKSILLLAIPDEYQLRFHSIKDAKLCGLLSRVDLVVMLNLRRCRRILLEVHGAAVSNEDANQKFLRALPSSWNNVALIMRNKTGIDDLDIDDLYNNLKVFEAGIKSLSGSSSNSQNVAFLSAEDTNSINEVNTANSVSTTSGHNSQGQASSSSYTNDLMFLFFANQPNSPQLDDEDLEYIVHDDLEEMDLKRECRAIRNQGNMNRDAGYRSRDNTKRTILVETSDALVVQDNALIVQNGLGYDWSYIAQDEPTEFALMAYTSGSDTEDNGYHDVPPPLTENYMPPLADLSFAGLDDSVYRPTANKTSASMSQVETSITPPSNTSVEMPRVESVRPIKPSFKKIEFTKARNELVKYDKQAVKPRMVTQSPKVDRKDWNGKMTQKQGLGFGSTKKACFVCGSYSHLIKDCDFHEKRMSKKSVLNDKGKGTGHREVRPIWNNTQRINHQNKFVPTAVLTRSGRIPVSTAKQYVNTATPKNRVNVSKSKINTFPKSHSPIRRPFYKSTVLNTRVSKEKVNIVRVNGVNTAGQTSVSTVKGNEVTAVKALAGYVWRPKMTDLNNGSKDNSGSWISKRGNPQQALKFKGMFDSGCSRHMTGNKALLTDYQDIDGGFVAFGGSTRGGKITCIGKIRTNKIDFEDVFFVKELKFNLFSISQMCDKKNNVLFTETECLVLSPDFKLIDESQVLLRVPRQNNMYNFNLKNVVPSGDLSCLFAKSIIDESKQ
ncbi:hypothetical protein Tco_0612527 [Tanacetum coccineum]